MNIQTHGLIYRPTDTLVPVCPKIFVISSRLETKVSLIIFLEIKTMTHVGKITVKKDIIVKFCKDCHYEHVFEFQLKKQTTIGLFYYWYLLILFNKSQFLLQSECLTLLFNLLPNDQILDMTKLKAFADNKLNIDKMTIFLLDRVENTEGKQENAGYQHFLLYPQSFLKLSSLGSAVCCFDNGYVEK